MFLDIWKFSPGNFLTGQHIPNLEEAFSTEGRQPMTIRAEHCLIHFFHRHGKLDHRLAGVHTNHPDGTNAIDRIDIATIRPKGEGIHAL